MATYGFNREFNQWIMYTGWFVFKGLIDKQTESYLYLHTHFVTDIVDHYFFLKK